MNLEKLVPRFSSFLPMGMYVNSKKDAKETIKKFFGNINEDKLNKYSKYVGGSYEGIRDILSLIGFSHSIEAGLITYGITSYILDRASNFGFLPIN